MNSGGTEAMSLPPATGRGAATLRPGTSAAAPTLRGTTAPAPASRARPPAAARPTAAPQRPAPSPGRPVGLYAVGALVVLAGAFAAWWFGFRPAPAPVAPSPTLAAARPSVAPSVAPVPSELPSEPPPTAAPPPTFADSAGAGAAPLRAAKAAFTRGDYDRALSEAQAALRADPQDAAARALADNALAGQKARARVTAGETALAQGDFAKAQAEADAARALAPWDERAVGLTGRVREAQQRAAQQAQDAAQKEAATRVNTLLQQADAALGARQYDQAVALYDQALALDPQNQRASLGRTGALAARAAQSAPTPAPGRAFVAGSTVAKAAAARTAGSLPPGFDDSPEASVRRGSQGADMPGKILFEVSPAAVKPGERYTLRIALLNEGSAPIQIARLTLTTVINGRKSSGPVTPSAKEIAPQQKAVLHSVSDLWSDETTAWSMEVTVDTARGERYTNQLSWK
jgi:tetratricopeptide (TPR) repeat protein